ncbi:hypothetical protein RHMOL_Rhmol01G0146900 [Rhododendron molle]|uniref:Uncharacterized protein n=1 Tax=Rhododendron molle TaxID=49168 RepID=A0ACC0Q1U3_RHOML|nr:hypothetical protein RHMOL_Rhmol01G0146900 [Rhododendron molle]
MGAKEGRGDLNAFRLYLDELSASQVPSEWVNVALCLMVAMEKTIRRSASGLPLNLCYLAPTPPLVQPLVVPRSHAQRRAAPRKKSARAPPQKKVAIRTPTPPASTQRQMSATRQATRDLQTARKNVARVKRNYLMKMRERAT